MTSPAGGDTTTVRTFCRICPAVCGLLVEIDAHAGADGARVWSVRGDPQHVLSRGYSCAKGRAVGALNARPDRLRTATVHGRPVEWPAVLDDLATTVAGVLSRHGPDAVGVYHGTWSWMDSLGRWAAERLWRRLGSTSVWSALTVDAVNRSAVSQLLSGSPSVLPNLHPHHTRLAVVWGSNPVVSHGHASGLPDPVRALRAVPELWVVDPRRTATAGLGRHLGLRPGSDAVLAAHLVREVLADGADREYLARHADGVARLAGAVAPFDRERAMAATGLSADEIDQLVGAIRRHQRVAVLSGTGITMAVDGLVTEWLLWALQIVTGSFDRPGGVWANPGYLAGLDRRTPGPPVPGPPGRFGEQACATLAHRIEHDELRALFVIGGNPVMSLPDHVGLRAALGRLEVLAVADVLPSQTTALATHVLACTDQLERADVSRSTDLFHPAVAVQVTPAVLTATPGCRPLWWVLAHMARRLGHDLLDGRDPDTVTEADLLAQLTHRAPRPVPHASGGAAVVIDVDEPRPVGWVHDTVLPGGRWQLAPDVLVERLGTLGAPPPLGVVPRRSTNRMNSVPVASGDDEILLHPSDAQAAGCADGAPVEVRSANGSVVGVARVTDGVAAGTVSVPHGLVGVDGPDVGLLTSPRSADPLTGMVAQAGIAVTIRPSAAGSIRGTTES